MVDQSTYELSGRWYHGITRYQWLVLAIASLGWVFDVFEGQIFVASMNEAMPSLVPVGTPKADLPFYNNITFGAFLLGGALGGVAFGMLSDRIGRTRTMVWTIVMYSAFTCLSAASQTWWHMAVFRFLVAMGVGGEWAVASAMVAEVFPKRARAWSLAIFHASSVLGTYLAIAAGAFIVADERLGWKWGFVLGALPALLVIWVRLSLREPENWRHARDAARQGGKPMGRVADLFDAGLVRHTLVGVGLAAVGLATFWGVHIYGKDLMRRAVEARYLAELPRDADDDTRQALLKQNFKSIKRGEMFGLLLVTTGGGLGLLTFGPLSERWGRRGTFLFFHLGGLVSAIVLFQTISGVGPLVCVLPIFGFLTLGMHAGYAIYFPELFPTRLRGTGGGFCFNFGRVIAAPILFIGGWMQSSLKMSLGNAASILSLLFLLGAAILIAAPETRGRELPE